MRSAARMIVSFSKKPFAFRQISSRSSNKTRQFKVLLDDHTLYVGQELAEAMGWSEKMGAEGVKLSLHGLSPTFFAITPSGSDNGEHKDLGGKMIY